MVHINLLEEKVDKRGIYILQAFIFVIVISLSTMGCLKMRNNLSSRLLLLTQQKTQMEQRITQLKKVTKQVQGLEDKKKTLKEKLLTIATLKAKKHGPVHILDELNKAIPDRAWLLSVKEKSEYLTLQGIALDNQTISAFMSNLEKSKHFKNVDPTYSAQYVLKGIKLEKFELSVQLEDPLAIKKAMEKQEIDPIKEVSLKSS